MIRLRWLPLWHLRPKNHIRRLRNTLQTPLPEIAPYVLAQKYNFLREWGDDGPRGAFSVLINITLKNNPVLLNLPNIKPAARSYLYSTYFE